VNLLLRMMEERGPEAVFGHVADLAGEPQERPVPVSGLAVLEGAGFAVPNAYMGSRTVRDSFLVVEHLDQWQAALNRLGGPDMDVEGLGAWGIWSIGIPTHRGLVVHVPDDNSTQENIVFFSQIGDVEGRIRLGMHNGTMVSSRFEASLHCHSRQCERDLNCEEACGNCRCTRVIQIVHGVPFRGSTCWCSGH
jgi:hypothetical protein